MSTTAWYERFGALADKPGDDDEEKLRHRFMLATGTAMSIGGLVWGALSIAISLPGPGTIPLGYAAITAVNVLVLSRTKNFAVARTVQALISLLLPFLFQWSLGGFVASGCVMIWALLSLVAALSFDELRQASAWLVIFVILTGVSGALEGQLPVPDVLADGVIARYAFPLNVGTVAVLVFGLTYFFSQARREASVLLRAKNREIADGQAALIASEKMAALGQLVAGVAHELNTPLGAIRASSGNLAVALEHAIEELPALLRDMSEAERAQWTQLVANARRAGQALGSSEERKARRKVAQAIADMGLADAETLAETLVELGVADPSAHLELLRSKDAARLVERAYDVTALHRNTENIRLAADRAAKIVFALKSYAHPGSLGGGSLAEGSLAESLDTVLTLYENLTKRGVEIVRDYEDVGPVVARHDELAQVWTNLVHNALQAMDGKGALTLRLRADAETAVVEIIDTGPGIPEAVRAHVFEPFFTTKPKGEGTGLGLSICRDIVERHGGTLTMESRPGNTTFVTKLPRRAPESLGGV